MLVLKVHWTPRGEMSGFRQKEMGKLVRAMKQTVVTFSSNQIAARKQWKERVNESGEWAVHG